MEKLVMAIAILFFIVLLSAIPAAFLAAGLSYKVFLGVSFSELFVPCWLITMALSTSLRVGGGGDD